MDSPVPRRRGSNGRISSLTCDLVAAAAVLAEASLGPEATSVYMATVGMLAGAEIEGRYREEWHIRRSLSPEKYAHILVDLTNGMGGGAFLISAEPEKVVLGSTRCPFGDLARSCPSLCRLTGSLFGEVGARNFGYSKVVHRRRIAAGDGGCETAIYLKRSPLSQTEEGLEYYPGDASVAIQAEPTGVAGRAVLAGQRLRETMLGLDVPSDRWRLLAKAGSLFRANLEVEEVLQDIAMLVSGELGGGSILYLNSPTGTDILEVGAVHHRVPSIAQALRGSPPANFWAYPGGVGRSLRDGVPLLVPNVHDGPVALPAEMQGTLTRLGLTSLLVVPLRVESRCLGVLVCAGEPARRFDERDLSVAACFGELASAAIETARTRLELGAALKVREMFSSIACHELLNALTSVKALVQMSLKALEKSSPESRAVVERNLRTLVQHADRLADLTRDVADGSLVVATQIRLRREATSINSVVAGVAERLQGIVGEHSMYQLRVEMPGVQLVGRWDRSRLDQVLTNLLVNAVKYSPKGGTLTVRVEHVEPTPEGAAGTRPPRALLMVRDEGIGIPEGERASVFEPFFRASNAHEGNEEGAGLGLFICKGIVEAHGGQIWVDSQVGRGTSIYVSLPLGETTPV